MSDKKEVGLVSPNVLECGIVHNLHRILIKTTKNNTKPMIVKIAQRADPYNILLFINCCSTIRLSSFILTRFMCPEK